MSEQKPVLCTYLSNFFKDLQNELDNPSGANWFHRSNAICQTLYNWCYLHKKIEVDHASLLVRNFKDFFRAEGLDATFPFNSEEEYARESDNGTFWDNPKRLSFTKKYSEM